MQMSLLSCVQSVAYGKHRTNHFNEFSCLNAGNCALFKQMGPVFVSIQTGSGEMSALQSVTLSSSYHRHTGKPYDYPDSISFERIHVNELLTCVPQMC